MQGGCKKTASRTPVSTQEKKMFAFAIKTRACARSSSMSMFVGLVVALDTIMCKVTGSNPVVFIGTFYPYGTLSLRGHRFEPGDRKKNQLFRFRLCPCLAGDPVIKLFSQLNPAHPGRAKRRSGSGVVCERLL